LSFVIGLMSFVILATLEKQATSYVMYGSQKNKGTAMPMGVNLSYSPLTPNPSPTGGEGLGVRG